MLHYSFLVYLPFCLSPQFPLRSKMPGYTPTVLVQRNLRPPALQGKLHPWSLAWTRSEQQTVLRRIEWSAWFDRTCSGLRPELQKTCPLRGSWRSSIRLHSGNLRYELRETLQVHVVYKSSNSKRDTLESRHHGEVVFAHKRCAPSKTQNWDAMHQKTENSLQITSNLPCLALQRFHLANLCSDFPSARRQCHLESGEAIVFPSKSCQTWSGNQATKRQVCQELGPREGPHAGLNEPDIESNCQSCSKLWMLSFSMFDTTLTLFNAFNSNPLCLSFLYSCTKCTKCRCGASLGNPTLFIQKPSVGRGKLAWTLPKLRLLTLEPLTHASPNLNYERVKSQMS